MIQVTPAGGKNTGVLPKPTTRTLTPVQPVRYALRHCHYSGHSEARPKIRYIDPGAMEKGYDLSVSLSQGLINRYLSAWNPVFKQDVIKGKLLRVQARQFSVKVTNGDAFFKAKLKLQFGMLSMTRTLKGRLDLIADPEKRTLKLTVAHIDSSLSIPGSRFVVPTKYLDLQAMIIEGLHFGIPLPLPEVINMEDGEQVKTILKKVDVIPGNGEVTVNARVAVEPARTPELGKI